MESEKELPRNTFKKVSKVIEASGLYEVALKIDSITHIKTASSSLFPESSLSNSLLKCLNMALLIYSLFESLDNILAAEREMIGSGGYETRIRFDSTFLPLKVPNLASTK